MLYKVHHDAKYDIRQLQDLIDTMWKTGSLNHENKETLIRSILKEVYAEKKRISNYLRDAESHLGSRSS